MNSSPYKACSWTTERQKHCNYESYLKLFYEAGDRGVWSIGSKLILKDRGASLPTFEVPNIQFVQEQTSIPVPTVVESWEEGDYTLILMRRIPGEPLGKSDKIQSLGGLPVYSNFLFKSKTSQVPHGRLVSDNELWADMEGGLKETIPEAARVQLRQCMPSALPYTFTHGDLTNVNVMVEDGSLTGIIDWEMSGYFPVWWEYVCTSVPDSEEDREWKALL
ncbi:hypothetical protein ANOM_001760 [Aspergillus nomiae NRRL 13137]|uniref:Aminoglycoside phosphotransferase domain-containing protein n=1 Tax=Aspergillus nomiae NRRL (strain ATCC 15546 / NRRL 13137 / CBS 260.88 / M93) TaxID=1509407 RepID=A0A0L1JDR1_ASPN3|nr:uncharacterized protein ANOM_001760 [Aspergillus nomiae NRRL 13137]KNG89852.1 hypothetical protein ANOM_001760 [Aspergillus nomiae NRRL 13137]